MVLLFISSEGSVGYLMSGKLLQRSVMTVLYGVYEERAVL